MFHFVALIFVTHSLQIIALSDSENNLLKYRTDLDQIGNDVENFLYDFTKDIIKKADTFTDNDYNWAYEGGEQAESETVENEIKKEKIKLTTTPATVTVIEDYIDAKNERIKRSISEEKLFTSAGKPDFKERTDSTVLEDQSLQEIKDELEKLTELTILLKDQQKILSVLNKEGTNDLSEEYDSQDLIQMLQNLEKDRKKIKPQTEKQENIDKLKTEIQKTISTLNKTNDEWKVEKGREIKLENQINQQKDDINALKSVVEQLLNQNNATNKGKNVFNKLLHNDEQDKAIKTKEELVGLPLFLPKSFPMLKENLGPKIENKQHKKANKDDNIAKEGSIIRSNIKSNTQLSDKLNEQTQKDKVTGKYMPIKNKVFNKTEETQHPEARASSVEKDISKLFDVIENPHKPKLEDKLKELEEQFNKESKEKAIKKELSILGKLLNDEKPASKSLLEDDDENSDDEDVQFLKRLQMIIKAINKESNKTEQKPEADVEARLKELQVAIDRLKPKEEITNPVRIDDVQHKGIPSEPKIENQPEHLTVKQLKHLRNKIDELILKEERNNDQIKPSISTGMSGQPQMYSNLDLKRGLLPYPLWYRGNSYAEPMGPPFFDYSSQSNAPYYYLPHSQLPEPAGREIIPNEGTKFLEPLGTDIRNQFFPAPQLFPAPPLFPARAFGDFDYNQEDPAGFVPTQPGHYQTEVNNHNLKKITNVNDLKSEINNLESILSMMNTYPYNEKFGNKGELKQLGQEVDGLKVIISSLGEDKAIYPVNPQSSITKTNYYSTRHKRSTESSYPTTDNKDELESPTNTQANDNVTSKLRQYFIEEENKERSAHYNELRNRLNRIKSQLEKESSYSQNQMEYWPFQQYQETPNKYPAYPITQTRDLPHHLTLATVPHEDISTTIITRILEKIIAALPKIIGKLFGTGVQKMIDNVDKTYGNKQENSYGYNYGVSNNNNNDLQSIFHKLGIFGYIPIIFLNFINALAKICKSLKKNKFFANFIVPGFVVLLVSGAVVFLIWWLQPEENSISINQIESDKFAGSSGNHMYDNYGRSAYGTNYNNEYRRSYGPYPVYDFNRTPWYNNNYLRNYENVEGRTMNGLNGISNSEGFPMGYYRSYFDDGSKRV